MILPIPTFEMTGGCSSCDRNRSGQLAVQCHHKLKDRSTHRVLPKNEVASIFQSDIRHSSQSFCTLTLLDLLTHLVLLLPRSDLRESDRNVLRELHSRSMERSSIGLRQASFVLSTPPLVSKTSSVSYGGRVDIRMVIEAFEQGKRERLREHRKSVELLVSCVLSVLRTLHRSTS